MAVAGMSIPASEGPSMEFDDYSLYGNLTDDELMQLAIERSLTNEYNSANATQTTLPVVQRGPNPPPRRHLPTPTSHPPPAHRPAHAQVAKQIRELDPLKSSIKHGDVKTLSDIMKCNPDSVIEPNEEGWIPIHSAAYYGQEECLKILLRAHPGTVNKRNLKSETPLLLAADYSNVSCVDSLLDSRADPEIPNKNGETPLFIACEKPNEAIVELLLEYGVSVNKRCVQGVTPLHVASSHGTVKICRMLLEAGAKLNAVNIYGISPLFTAAQTGRVELLTYLIKQGADINCQARDGATPLYEASKNGHEEAVRLLLSKRANANLATKANLWPLHVAVKKGHIRIVHMLIPATSKIRIQQSGISPLHYAAERNRNEILEMLIDAGYDVNAELSKERSNMYKDHRSTALYFAVSNSNVEATAMLLEARADPNVDMFNPLLIAVMQGCLKSVTLLMEHGANVNAYISTRPTSFPAVIMLCMNNVSMLKYLMDNGCDALSCFNCTYGSKTHPPLTTSDRYGEDIADASPKPCVQFCEVISNPSMCSRMGPVIDVLLDYVGQVKLCSRLVEYLDGYHDWAGIKEKAMPPHPLMQLCRLKIRQQVGIPGLRLIDTLPLPERLIKFLNYDSLDSLDY